MPKAMPKAVTEQFTAIPTPGRSGWAGEPCLRIWNSKNKRWWGGEFFVSRRKLSPLVAALNAGASPHVLNTMVTALRPRR